MWSGVVQPRWRRRKTLSGTCLYVGAYSTLALFLIFTGSIVIKKKYVSFLQCQLSLSRFSVSFVHRPLKIEKVSAEYIEGAAALVLCDFYQSIFFIGDLSVSKSPTDEYRMVQYRLRAINMQKIEKLRWKNFVYVQDSLCLFLAHTEQ